MSCVYKIAESLFWLGCAVANDTESHAIYHCPFENYFIIFTRYYRVRHIWVYMYIYIYIDLETPQSTWITTRLHTAQNCRNWAVNPGNTVNWYMNVFCEYINIITRDIRKMYFNIYEGQDISGGKSCFIIRGKSGCRCLQWLTWIRQYQMLYGLRALIVCWKSKLAANESLCNWLCYNWIMNSGNAAPSGFFNLYWLVRIL